MRTVGGPEESLPPMETSELNVDQQRAYGILLWHLNQTIAGASVPKLRMIVLGEGGTGKSRVIQTVSRAFDERGMTYMLGNAAYTGIAASPIDGKTTHVIARISVTDRGRMTDESKQALQAFWKNRRYLILDEYSMLSKSFLAVLERHISIAMEDCSNVDSSQQAQSSFGGLNVVLCGDPHQFPPVATHDDEALFKPLRLGEDGHERSIGRKLYEHFTTVVKLTEQVRVTDQEWHKFLQALRMGQVTDEHLNMLRTLLLKPEKDGPFSPHSVEAALVTPRHSVRQPWNAATVRKWCEEKGERLYVITADDSIRGRPLSIRERYGVVGRKKGARGSSKRDLPETLELAIGMKVMVTTNLMTDLDVTNGARGTIIDIIFDPGETVVPQHGQYEVHLKHVPSYILVQLERTRATQLEGLEGNVIPVEPVVTSMRIRVRERSGKTTQWTVKRVQLPVTVAYAFTDYRSQGQTIPFVIVDIKKPPGPGRFTLFNIYVALSRSRGRHTIRILRDFDGELLKRQQDGDLLVEDDRLDTLNQQTKEWWDRMHASGHVHLA